MNRIFFICFLTPLAIFSQSLSIKSIKHYEDFPIVSNLDSLEKAVYAKNKQSRDYLNGLISLEKSRATFQSYKFGTNLKEMEQLATQQKFPLAIATTQYLSGANTVKDDVSKATPNIIAATKYFESQQDTTAMLLCYSFMIVVNKSLRIINTDNRTKEIRGNLQSIETYYNKIMSLGETSTDAIDKIIRLQTIIAYYSLIYKKEDLKQEKKALDEALTLIDQNPKYEYLRLVFLVRAAALYQNAGQYKEALTYQLASYNLGKNSERIMFNNNLGYTYLLIGDYKNAEKYAKKAIAIFKANKRDDEIGTVMSAYSLLSDAQYNLKNYQAAWASKHSSDSLAYVNEKALTDKTYLELQTKYETEKKEQANKELREQQQRLYVYLFLGLLAFVVFAVILFRLRSANTRIKELMKHRDQFYTIVAHDLRGPINTLSDIGNVIRFLVKNNRTADLAEVTNRIDTVSAETSLLLNNLIEWGKSNNYKVVTKQQVFDAAQVIKELYDSHKTLAEAKGIDMSIDIPEQLEVAADPKSLSLILRNLLDNARKFTPDGKNIKIFVEKLKNHVNIHVKDSGQGIPTEQLEYIQQVFAGKIKPEVGEHGLGLGIILINDFAHKNGMTLNVTSKVGVGSCFSLVVNA